MRDSDLELQDAERNKITSDIGVEMLNRSFSEVHFEYGGSNDTLAVFVLYAIQHGATRLDLARSDPVRLKLDDLIGNVYGNYTDEAGADGKLTLRVGTDDDGRYVGVAWTHHQRYTRPEPNNPTTLTENFIKDISEIIDDVASRCVIEYYGKDGEMDAMDFIFRNSDGNLVFHEKDTLTDILEDQVTGMIQKSVLKDLSSGEGGYGTISVDTLNHENCYWNNWKYVTEVRDSEQFFDTDFDYPKPSKSAVHSSRVKTC